jgi:phosphoribosylformylglycinamidine cyclo-ligase
VAIGIASSGFHSNGYSLVRKAVMEIGGLGISDRVAELENRTVGEVLLTPTRLYARPVKAVLRHYRVKQVVHGIAHITGGGLVENLARIVPPQVQVRLARGSWPVPPVFPWVQRLGGIASDEMERVFNMGIGMVLVVAPHFVASIQSQLADLGFESSRIGEVVDGRGLADRVVLG